jgi:hypothetical protein
MKFRVVNATRLGGVILVLAAVLSCLALVPREDDEAALTRAFEQYVASQ